MLSVKRQTQQYIYINLIYYWSVYFTRWSFSWFNKGYFKTFL